jgi:nitrogen fixation protein
MMFKPLTENLGKELLMSYLADFHAKTLVQPEEEKVLGGGEVQCGNTWQESLAKLDQDTALWKTAQCSLLEDLEQSLEIWPRWGSMRNGECFRQPMLAQTTKEKEFGWLEKIPTPTASDHKRTPMKEVYANRPKTLGVADDLAKWAVRKSGLAHARLEPALWEWAMGWPEGWTELRPLEMDKSPCVQQQLGNF